MVDHIAGDIGACMIARAQVAAVILAQVGLERRVRFRRGKKNGPLLGIHGSQRLVEDDAQQRLHGYGPACLDGDFVEKLQLLNGVVQLLDVLLRGLCTLSGRDLHGWPVGTDGSGRPAGFGNFDSLEYSPKSWIVLQALHVRIHVHKEQVGGALPDGFIEPAERLVSLVEPRID